MRRRRQVLKKPYLRKRETKLYHGKTTKRVDRKRKALAPGVRISKYGNKYTETRANRSDKKAGRRGYTKGRYN
jgi:hypothetical protein